MTELAVPEQHQPAVPVPAPAAPALPEPAPTAGTTALMAWAQEADLAYQMAQKLAATSFVPQSLRGKPGDITAAILAGSELGLKPMATLKSIDVIQGTPALRAHAMRGILQSHGHEIELVESDDVHCVMRGRRKGAEAWQTVTWDIPRATRLGLLGKDQWKKQPKSMLVARATGELCRLIASDALHGMPYAAEELEAQPRITAAQVAPARPLSIATLTGQPTPAAEPEASDDDTSGDTGWQPDTDDSGAAWPEVAQPPQ